MLGPQVFSGIRRQGQQLLNLPLGVYLSAKAKTTGAIFFQVAVFDLLNMFSKPLPEHVLPDIRPAHPVVVKPANTLNQF